MSEGMQPGLMAAWAKRYVDVLGLAVVPIPPGLKAPKDNAWNQPGGYFTDAAAAAAFWLEHPQHNMGAVLGPSGVCSLDVDDVPATRQVLADLMGMDVDAMADSLPTVVGNPARFRIMFRAPAGFELGRKALSWPVQGAEDAKKRFTVFELRHGLVQDVLPPSIHPETGKPYVWRTPPTFDGLPELPAELLAIWQNWEFFKRDAEAACPWAPREEPRPSRKAGLGVSTPAGPGGSVIEAFNRAHDVEQLLERHGYKRRGKKWLFPASSTGLPGVTVSEGRVFSHHAADPLANGHQNDAFDVFCLLEYGGDQAAAVKAAAKVLGIEPRLPPRPRIPPAGLAPASEVESAAGRESEPGEEAPAQDWRELLRRNDSGLLPELSNAYLILKNDPAWQGVLSYNEFADRIEKITPPPVPDGGTGPWSDVDASKALVWLQMTYGLRLRSSAIADEAARMVAWDNKRHPVREWLASLPPWEGHHHLENLLPDVFGAVKNEYTSHVGKALLVSAIARVMNPGCKVDEMVVLEGGQGLGKSTCIAELFGFGWYLETAEAPSNKDFYVVMQGNWVVEIGEMQSFSKADITQVKMTITRRDDKYRAPYDRHATSHPRQCVFVGTTNADSYLSDPSGARRFLPVMCTKADVELVRRYRMQLWAEALALYRQGFRYWDYPKEIAAAEQDARYVEDPWEEAIVRYVEGEAPEAFYPPGSIGKINEVTIMGLLRHALQMDLSRMGKPEQRRIADVLRRMGWERARQRRVPGTGERIRPYLRPGSPEALAELKAAA